MKLTILLTTYMRTELAVRTVESALKNIVNVETQLLIYDDGSDNDNREVLREKFSPLDMYNGNRRGVGHGMNWGLARAKELDSEHIMILEDDWELVSPLDPIPAMNLTAKEDYGMVRYGYLSNGPRGTIIGDEGKLWLKMEPYQQFQYTYAGHPSIKHTSFHNFYGKFTEGLSPKQNELNFCSRVNQKPDGPSILWCLDYGYMGPFHHIGTESIGDIAPNV